MPVIRVDELKSYRIPPKSKDKLCVGLSHEFVELYRGDKDLRVGKILCNDYNCEVVHFGTDIASPLDSKTFNVREFPVKMIGELNENYYFLQLKSRAIVYNSNKVGGFFRWSSGLTSEVVRWQPDILFESPFLTLRPRSYMTYFATRILKIPTVYLDSGDIELKLGPKHKVLLPVEKRVIQNSSAVITYNIAGKKRFISKYNYPAEKIFVIPKPIDTNRFSPDIDSHRFKEKYDLQGYFTVAYFGRISAQKGVMQLLDAAKILHDRGIDQKVKIVFVGGNIDAGKAVDLKSRLAELDLNNIVFTGMIPNNEMPEAYAAIDIAVFPDFTNKPAFTTVLAESMASGLPIILGVKGWEDATPIRDGEHGIIIEPSDPEQIANSIELLMNNRNLRNSIGKKARSYAEKYMNYDCVVEKYYAIFQNTLSRSDSGKHYKYDENISRYTEKAAV